MPSSGLDAVPFLGAEPLTCPSLALLVRGVRDAGRVKAQSLLASLRHLWHGAVPSCMHLSFDRLHFHSVRRIAPAVPARAMNLPASITREASAHCRFVAGVGSAMY
jgi:hypothetical protein